MYYIAFVMKFIFENFSDRPTDRQTDIMVHREVTLPKIALNGDYTHQKVAQTEYVSKK